MVPIRNDWMILDLGGTTRRGSGGAAWRSQGVTAGHALRDRRQRGLAPMEEHPAFCIYASGLLSGVL